MLGADEKPDVAYTDIGGTLVVVDRSVAWNRIQLGSVFSNFVDPDPHRVKLG